MAHPIDSSFIYSSAIPLLTSTYHNPIVSAFEEHLKKISFIDPNVKKHNTIYQKNTRQLYSKLMPETDLFIKRLYETQLLCD